MDTPDRPEGERIAKLLARAGVASRREIERMIADGRIAKDGVRVETPATILPNLRGVTVDGNPVAQPEPTRLFRFHKPSGLITAERDPAGRPTIYTALRNALPPGTPRLMPVGRLDLNTEGLLLLTNDGEFKRQLELPSTGIPRTYRARTFGDISQAQLEDLMDGITIEGVHYGPIDANLERRTGSNQWIELTLTEGKNREVRRVLEHLGLQVSRLLRTAYGPFELGDLPRGIAAEVRPADLDRFRGGVTGVKRPRPAAATTSDSPRASRSVGDTPRSDRPRGDRPRNDGPRSDRPRSDRTRDDRPRSDGPRSNRTRGDGPRSEKPRRDGPRSDRPRSDRPLGDKPGSDRSRSDKPLTDKPRSDRPRSDRSRDDRQRTDKPRNDQPWSDKPRSDKSRSDRPQSDRPRSGKPPQKRRFDGKPSKPRGRS